MPGDISHSVQSPGGFVWRGFSGFVPPSVSSSFGAGILVRSARRWYGRGRYRTSCQRTLRRNVSAIIIVAERGVIHRIDHFKQRDRVPPFGETGVLEVRCLEALARPWVAGGVQ